MLVVAAAQPSRYFVIQIVDEQTGRGVPLVELTTTNDSTWYTDSNGIVAFDEPGLMGREVFFHIASPGYLAPDAGFDNRGQKLKTTPGGRAVVRIKRLNIAERLYAMSPRAGNTAGMVAVKDEAGRTVGFGWKNPCTTLMLDRN